LNGTGRGQRDERDQNRTARQQLSHGLVTKVAEFDQDVAGGSDLVADTVYWADPDWFVPLLGVFEIVVGVSLLARRALRATLGLFALQMMGTFLVLVVQPAVAFQDGNPLLLTVEGEFVIKNLVLLSAGMVVGATVRRRQAIARSGSVPLEPTFTNV